MAVIKANLLEWRFANNPQNVGEIERLASKLQLSISEFGREFLLADASDVKNSTCRTSCAST